MNDFTDETSSVSLIEKTVNQTESRKIEKENPNTKTGQSIGEYKTSTNSTSGYVGSFTKGYIKMNLNEVLNDLIKILIEWRESFGESSSILQIHKLHKILENNDKFFYSSNEARVLITLLKLIFSNNNWLKTKDGQLGELIEALRSFKKGELDSKKLDIFVNQIFRAKLQIFAN